MLNWYLKVLIQVAAFLNVQMSGEWHANALPWSSIRNAGLDPTAGRRSWRARHKVWLDTRLISVGDDMRTCCLSHGKHEWWAFKVAPAFKVWLLIIFKVLHDALRKATLECLSSSPEKSWPYRRPTRFQVHVLLWELSFILCQKKIFLKLLLTLHSLP